MTYQNALKLRYTISIKKQNGIDNLAPYQSLEIIVIK